MGAVPDGGRALSLRTGIPTERRRILPDAYVIPLLTVDLTCTNRRFPGVPKETRARIGGDQGSRPESPGDREAVGFAV